MQFKCRYHSVWTFTRACLLLGVISFAPGCVLSDRFKHEEEPPGPPDGPVHQVVATWNNQVVVTPDAVNGGANLYGIAGRLYFFGPEIGFPVRGDGTLSVALYDASDPAKSRLVEVWKIDKETLTRLCRKDRIGWGYTLFLPWKNYHPDINKIEMVARYHPEKGYPMYAPKTKITLNRVDGSIVPASHRVAAKDLAKAKTAAKGAVSKPPVPNYQKHRIPMPNGRPQFDKKQSFRPIPIPKRAAKRVALPQAHEVASPQAHEVASPQAHEVASPQAHKVASPQAALPVPEGIRAKRVSGTSTRVVVQGTPQQVRKTLYGSFSKDSASPQAGVVGSPQAGQIRVFPRPVKSSITPAPFGTPTGSQSPTIHAPAGSAPQDSSGLYDPRAGNAVYPARR